MGFFDKLKQGLTKTKESINDKINNVFSNFRKVDEELLEELEEALIMSDMGVETSTQIISNLREKIKKEKIEESEQVKEALREEIEKILEKCDNSLKLETKPSVILVVGVNGVGKTTSIGKMAARLARDGKKVIVAAADTSYNIDTAIQILEDNGWEYKYNRWQQYINYSTKIINFKLVVQASNETRVAIADIIKSNLEEAGIKVTLVKATDNQYQSYLDNRNYDMILTGVTLSLSPNLETFFGDGNLANFSNEELNSIMNEVKNITKEDLLKEKYTRIRQIYNDEVPYIGLFSNYYEVASNWTLKGSIPANWYNIFINIDNWYKN